MIRTNYPVRIIRQACNTDISAAGKIRIRGKAALPPEKIFSENLCAEKMTIARKLSMLLPTHCTLVQLRLIRILRWFGENRVFLCESEEINGHYLQWAGLCRILMYLIYTMMIFVSSNFQYLNINSDSA